MRSAFPNWIKCAEVTCVASQASAGPESAHDDATVSLLRDGGWAVVGGQWRCSQHVPPNWGSRANPHCSNCGDLTGGPYGHQSFECTREPL